MHHSFWHNRAGRQPISHTTDFDLCVARYQVRIMQLELCATSRDNHILIDLLYDKPNAKGVVWDMCGDVIIDNLLMHSSGMLSYPENVDDNEEFECCRKKFKMKQITIGGHDCGEI